MSGLDRRGYAGGGNIGGGRISGTPMGSRTGFQDNRWERYGRNLRNWYSNLGKPSRAAGVRGPGFTMSPPYTGSTLPVPYSKPPLLSVRGLLEAAKKGWGKGAGNLANDPAFKPPGGKPGSGKGGWFKGIGKKFLKVLRMFNF